jgi:predicted transcriptional regulator
VPENNGDAAAAALRRVEVARLHVEGYTQREIAAIVGVSQCQVWKDEKANLDEWREQRAEYVDQLVDLVVRRAESMFREAAELLREAKSGKTIVKTRKKTKTGTTTRLADGTLVPGAASAETTTSEEPFSRLECLGVMLSANDQVARLVGGYVKPGDEPELGADGPPRRIYHSELDDADQPTVRDGNHPPPAASAPAD